MSPPDPRDYFAAERTFLAWIRTGLSLMGFGFVVARFVLFLREMALANPGIALTYTGYSRWFGVSLSALGVLVTAVSFADYVATVGRMKRGEPFVARPTWLGGTLAVLLVAIGVLMTIYLFNAS